MDTKLFIAFAVTLAVTAVVAYFFRKESIYIRTMMLLVTFVATFIWFTPIRVWACITADIALVCLAMYILFCDFVKTPADSLLNKKNITKKPDEPNEKAVCSRDHLYVDNDGIMWGHV